MTVSRAVPAELTRLADASDDQDWSERFSELLNTLIGTGHKVCFASMWDDGRCASHRADRR